MNLNNLKSIFIKNGCRKIYVKKLSPNDNSKNQVYLGGSFELLNIFPISSIQAEAAGDWKRERFKASINFSWVNDDSNIYPAPQSQFILYPKYPEVRLSGFLSGCEKSPSNLMTNRIADRLLFLSISKSGSILGYVAAPDSAIAKEFNNLNIASSIGVFYIVELSGIDTRQKLIDELRRIHLSGWINSKRLDKDGNILPCLSSNCGGYTLEAELGVTPNGYSEPDYLGWEIKQFNVRNFNLLSSSVITLMTPEPTGGYYHTNGVEAFIKKYGYGDLMGRTDRMNFGGIHKVGECHNRTKLKMELIGFDSETKKIKNSDGKIALVDKKDNEAASWSFSSLLQHWNRKHNQACYVPSIYEKNIERKYKFGDKIILGIGTDFRLFLIEMFNKNIYYDPGIKIENMSTSPKSKRRSQFRIKSRFLSNLYTQSEIFNL